MFRKKCNHDWELVVDKVLGSAYEQCADSIKHLEVLDMRNFFRKMSITILRCTKCGKLDKTIVNSQGGI